MLAAIVVKVGSKSSARVDTSANSAGNHWQVEVPLSRIQGNERAKEGFERLVEALAFVGLRMILRREKVESVCDLHNALDSTSDESWAIVRENLLGRS